MPAALSLDLRERVIAAIEAGASRRQAAKRFGIGASSAIRWHERFLKEGATAPRSPCERPSPAIEVHAERILQASQAHPQAFLRELRDTLAKQGIGTSVSGLWRFFSRHRITRKKSEPLRVSRRLQLLRGWSHDEANP
ncbi:IS630 transposase-related protein, partial [Methylobacterium trifolii]